MIGFLVAGLIIGASARLIKPGRQNLGLPATLGIVLLGSLIGCLIPQLFDTGGCSSPMSSASCSQSLLRCC